MNHEKQKPRFKKEWLDELVSGCRSSQDLFGPEGVLTQLKGALMERILQAEMAEHLGYAPNQCGGAAQAGNSRNGSSDKTVQTESGPVTIAVPRDRAGSFEPQLIPKHRRRLEGFDEKVLALYARGMTVRDIQAHLKELYATEISPELITRVTDAVLEELKLWQSRPLEALYPIVYLDALFVHVREQGQVLKKAVYLALGVRLDGSREVLGLWLQESEGAKFWLSVLTELKQRGLQDILFVCCDGLSGFSEAVEAAFPKTVVQLCIVHLIRASLRYVAEKDRRAVVQALRAIYGAEHERAAAAALDAFESAWGAKYPSIVTLWRNRWREIVPFLAYPEPVRKILYTTNAIESLNYQLRKVLKPKGHFPSDDALLKVLYLAIQNAQAKWKPSPYWKLALTHFAIMFGERIPA